MTSNSQPSPQPASSPSPDVQNATVRPRPLTAKETKEQNALFTTHRTAAQAQLEGVTADPSATPPRAQVLGVREHHRDLVTLVQKLSRAQGAAPTASPEVTRDISTLSAAQGQLIALSGTHRLSQNAQDGAWWAAHQSDYANCRRTIALSITEALAHPYWNDREEEENVPVADRLNKTLLLLNRTIEPSGDFPGGHTSIDTLNTTITETISYMQRFRKPAKPKAKKDLSQDADFNTLRTTAQALCPLLNQVALEEYWNRPELHVGKREIVGARAADMSAALYSIVQSQDFAGLVTFVTEMNTLETDMMNSLAKHPKRPDDFVLNPESLPARQSRLNIANLQLSTRQKLWGAGLAGGMLVVTGLGWLAMSANSNVPANTNPPAAKQPAGTPSGTPALSTATNTAKQDMGVQGFTVRREGTTLKFEMPAGVDQSRVKLSMGQNGGVTTVLTPVSSGAEWIANIDPAYLQKGTPVRLAVQYFDGAQWQVGQKIEVPLQ